MNVYGCLLLFSFFAGSVATAQLVLPDFYVDDENGHERSDGGAREGGDAHSIPETGDEVLNPEQVEQQMRQMMQAMQARRPRMGRGQNPDLEMEGPLRPRQDFLAGPEVLVIQVEHTDGRRVRLDIPNQTVRVLTRVGPLPLRLHEVAELKRQGDDFRVLFRDQDQIGGQPERIYIPVKDQTDRFQPLPMEGIEIIRVGPSG